MVFKKCWFNTAVPLGHDRTTICEKMQILTIVVRIDRSSYYDRDKVFKIMISVTNFEHVQNKHGAVVAKSSRSRSVVRAQ